jgi:hypothetical protein
MGGNREDLLDTPMVWHIKDTYVVSKYVKKTHILCVNMLKRQYLGQGFRVLDTYLDPTYVPMDALESTQITMQSLGG